MIQELLYTSHDGKGLRQGGGGGFCTVLSTTGMAANLASALEQLSGYKHPFDIHDVRSANNPVNYRYVVIRVGGITYYVLSRIADLRREHTGRSNKLAHHVALTKDVLPPGGPSFVMSQSKICRSTWDGRVTLVPEIPISVLPKQDMSIGPCRSWEKISGDAGWAGVAAEHLLSNRQVPFSVIAPINTDSLALVNEVLSLVPPQERWGITFSTYFTSLPAGTSCALRFLLDGTQEAEQLRRDYRQKFIDFTINLDTPPDSEWVALARTGKRQTQTTKPTQVLRGDSLETTGREGIVGTGASARGPSSRDRQRQPLSTLGDDLELEPQRSCSRHLLNNSNLEDAYSQPKSRHGKRPSKAIWIGVAAAALLMLVSALTGGTFYARWISAGGKDLIASKELANEEISPAPQNAIHPVEGAADTSLVETPNDSSKPNGAGPASTQSTQAGSSNIPADVPATQPTGTNEGATSNVSETTLQVTSIEAGSDSTLTQTPPKLPSIELPLLKTDKSALTSREWPIDEAIRRPNSIKLIGLHDLATPTHTWIQKLSEDNTLEISLSWKGGITHQLTSSPVARFRVDGEVIRFEWIADAIGKYEGARRTVANGLRWCLLEFDSNGKSYAIRLSKPQASSQIKFIGVDGQGQLALPDITLPFADRCDVRVFFDPPLPGSDPSKNSVQVVSRPSANRNATIETIIKSPSRKDVKLVELVLAVHRGQETEKGDRPIDSELTFVDVVTCSFQLPIFQNDELIWTKLKSFDLRNNGSNAQTHLNDLKERITNESMTVSEKISKLKDEKNQQKQLEALEAREKKLSIAKSEHDELQNWLEYFGNIPRPVVRLELSAKYSDASSTHPIVHILTAGEANAPITSEGALP